VTIDDESRKRSRTASLARRLGLVVALAWPGGEVAAHPRRSETQSPSPRPRARRIDLELQDADIHDVLDLFAEIGRVSIVTERGIPSKKVTARLVGVPWDEALAGILRSVGLGMMRDGTVIYVVTSAS